MAEEDYHNVVYDLGRSRIMGTQRSIPTTSEQNFLSPRAGDSAHKISMCIITIHPCESLADGNSSQILMGNIVRSPSLADSRPIDAGYFIGYILIAQAGIPHRGDLPKVLSHSQDRILPALAA